MAKNKNVWMFFTLSIAMIAMMLLAAGLSRLEFLPGQYFPFRELLQQLLVRPAPGEGELSPVRVDGFVRMLIFIFVWVLLPITIVSLLVSAEMRRKLFKRLLVWSAWVIFIYLVIQTIRAANESGATAGIDLAPPDLSSVRFPTPPEFITNPPQWFVITISLILAAFLVGGIWFIWRRLHQRESPLELLASEAQEALEELYAGGDLKDVVMRCYFEMSRVLSQQRGIRRHKNMTPREFEQYLTAVGLRDEHIRQLTQLFEAVRYGAKHPGPREEHEAVVCLQAIVQTYGRSA